MALVDDLQTAGVERIETHASWVLLDDELVHKVKKPVDFGFLNYSTPELRRKACGAEVELNRRLAPDVYRRVLPVTRDASGRHRFDGEGEPVDWAVEMVRLPDDARADHLLETGELTLERLDGVASRLARFHADVPQAPDAGRYGVEGVRQNVRENFEQTRDVMARYLTPDESIEIEQRQLGFLRENAALFEERVAAERVRDGHGDLRLEHVYFMPDPVVIDCIEFNDRFRYADVCSDIAFLSMDLARHHRVDLAEFFIAAYARWSGDYGLYRVVDFYEAYRAFVRGKVASMLARDSGAPRETRQRAEHEARGHFMLALASQREPLVSPAVVAVGGMIASGKSNVAERVGAALSAAVVSSDWTRKQLHGVAPDEPLTSEAFQGAYSKEATARVYAEMLERARRVLESGRPVVLDATFGSRSRRAEARALAERFSVPFHFVECVVDDETRRARLLKRREKPSVSDGRLEILEDMKKAWEPIGENEGHRIAADTSRPKEEVDAMLAAELPVWPEGLTG